MKDTRPLVCGTRRDHAGGSEDGWRLQSDESDHTSPVWVAEGSGLSASDTPDAGQTCSRGAGNTRRAAQNPTENHASPGHRSGGRQTASPRRTKGETLPLKRQLLSLPTAKRACPKEGNVQSFGKITETVDFILAALRQLHSDLRGLILLFLCFLGGWGDKPSGQMLTKL